jgi:hypothetical protein
MSKKRNGALFLGKKNKKNVNNVTSAKGWAVGSLRRERASVCDGTWFWNE